MHLIYILVFLAALFNFVAEDIVGKDNSLADNLSRNNLQYFSQILQARHYQPPKLNTRRLDQTVLGYYEAALSHSTHKSYKVDSYLFVVLFLFNSSPPQRIPCAILQHAKPSELICLELGRSR